MVLAWTLGGSLRVVHPVVLELGGESRPTEFHHLTKAIQVRSVPKVGAVGEERFVVQEQHLIDFAHDGMPAILCTPWLVWFLEHAARKAMLPFLEPGESTVGVVVNLEHIAATPLGAAVTCQARVIYVDGRVISFQLEAFDEHERIARGTHKLKVIQAERLAEKIADKMRSGTEQH